MREVKQKEIDGLLIRSQQLGASSAFKLSWKLGQVLMPALAKATGSSSLGSMEVSKLAGAFESLFHSMQPDEALSLARELLTCTTAQVDDKVYDLGPGGKFDTIFQGKMLTLWKVMKFAFEVNFEDFFAALPGLKAKAEETMGQNSQA